MATMADSPETPATARSDDGESMPPPPRAAEPRAVVRMAAREALSLPNAVDALVPALAEAAGHAVPSTVAPG